MVFDVIRMDLSHNRFKFQDILFQLHCIHTNPNAVLLLAYLPHIRKIYQTLFLKFGQFFLQLINSLYLFHIYMKNVESVLFHYLKMFLISRASCLPEVLFLNGKEANNLSIYLFCWLWEKNSIVSNNSYWVTKNSCKS